MEMHARIKYAAGNQRHSRRTVLMVCAGIVLLVFFSSIAIAPANKFREFQKLAGADSLFAGSFDSVYYHPDIQALLKEKAYKESLLDLSQSDSIQLIVNLSDSIIGLSIKGVIIHQTRISEYRKDKFLVRLPFMHEIKLLSRPLPVHSQYATIVKEPVVIRHAPRDTLEAAMDAWQPDTLIQNPAFVTFLTGQGLRIIIEQDRNDRFRDHWKKFGFYSRLNAWKAMRALSNFVRLSGQEYEPVMTIKMPVEELRAVYRALPENSLIVLKL